MKKVINNITQPLNQLIRNAFAKADTRRYFYDDCVWNATTRSYDATSNRSRTYTIPINGYYTIRVYSAFTGGYGKVIGKFNKGETIQMNFAQSYVYSSWQTTGINITSSTRNVNEFVLNVSHDAIINGTSNDFIAGLAIGGGGTGISYIYYNGGNAYVRCNNGIAVGGGGRSNFASSYVSDGVRGYNGGNAYAWGTNVYAIGGGAGAGGGVDEYPNNVAFGGYAIVNDNVVSASYNEARMNNGIYSCGGSSTRKNSYSGGNGGCGGAGFIYESRDGNINIACGYGFWGDGGNEMGGSAHGGTSSLEANGTRLQSRGYGYFAGGAGVGDSRAYYNGVNGGNGGFYGGSGGYANNSSYIPVHNGNGGIGTYGFGGNGWYAGDGQLMGGSGDYGGNGLKAGTGTISNGTAIRHKSIVHTLPAFNKTGNNSIVIIEYGISQDNY